MFLYKVRAIYADVEDARKYKRMNEDKRSSYARNLFMLGEDYNIRNQDRYALFVGNIVGDFVDLGLISTTKCDSVAIAKEYLKEIGICASEVSSSEITITSMIDLLRLASRNDFVDDMDPFSDMAGWNFLDDEQTVCRKEHLIRIREKEEIFAETSISSMEKDLKAELKRIYKGGLPHNGHPVHYLIETDNETVRNQTVGLLLSALYSMERVSLGRYLEINFNEYMNYNRSPRHFGSWFQAAKDGCVVINMDLVGEGCEDAPGSDFMFMTQLGKNISHYRNDVLSIICLPGNSKRIKDLLYEEFAGMSFIEISEKAMNYSQSVKYMKELAKKDECKGNKKLFAQLDEDLVYSTAELNKLYREWYGERIKNVLFPQYRNIHTISRLELEKKPDGDAYADLEKMIGLKAAKDVINQALDFYKFKKVYANDDFKISAPAMHMVFTGNPGTAKTSVARLFARILRDNKILENGQLVEVGRSDLVGKYVGWTAKIVQQKFKEAHGGVLFIDEAYSLVDDRKGSYGDEAINTIVQEMENHRDDVVVIFAGYKDEMDTFLAANPGLKSRIAFHVPFEDYSAEELTLIAKKMADDESVILSEDAVEKIQSINNRAVTTKDFGNGRYVRNLMERARMRQASRIVAMKDEQVSKKTLMTLIAEDIVDVCPAKEEKTAIGFAGHAAKLGRFPA